MAYKFTAIPGVGSGVRSQLAPGTPYPFQAVSGIGAKVAPTINFSQTDVAPTSSVSGRAPTGAAAEPWWMTGLNILSAPGKIVTEQTANWTDDKWGWNDLPVWNQVSNFGKGVGTQWDNWNDGQLTFDDIPVISGLANMGREMPGFSQTLDNLGVENERAKFWGGLAGDIALDPLTWITFGASSAVKSGGKAMAGAARDVAADYGIQMGKVTKSAIRNLPDAVDHKVWNDLLESGSSFRVAENQADYAKQLVKQRIQDAGKAGRAKAQNALINIDVPFTKTTYQIGKKPASWAKSSPTIKGQGANALNTLMTRSGIDPSTTGAEFIQKALGKTNLEDITFQEYNWLKGELKNFGEFAAKAQNAGDPFTSAKNGLQFGTKTISPGNTPAPGSAVDGFNFSSRFVPDMGGRSVNGQKFFDAVRAINPRQVGTAASGGLVNEAGGLIQDTFNRIRNNLGNRLPQTVQDVMRQAEDFSPNDQRALEYVLEGEFPTGFDMNSFDATKVYRAAETLRTHYDDMAKSEGLAGVLDSTRGGYAPHVVNRSPEKVAEVLQKYADDPELQNLAKVSASNSFNQSRKGFKSFAQLDNYIAGIGQKIAAETDPAEIAKLQAKMDDVSGIFERDPFKAFQKRLYKSYRVRELGDLYKTMKDDGLLMEPDMATYDEALYVALNASEAKRLNVPNGTVMHREVKDALMQADKIFTNDGMNKFVEKVTSITNIWKGLTTTIRPVHHLNNLVGNIFNNTLAGVEVGSYKRAMQTLNRVSRGKPKQEDLELMELAMKNGIFGQGHSDEYRRIFGDTPAKGIRKAEDFVQNNRVTSFMRRWLGDTTDNWSRLAHFESVLNKTGDAKLAADSTRKFLFNYGEHTGMDRTIRLAIPFWTWTKNNIPLQLEQLMKQPRYYQTYLRLQDASYESQGLDRQDQRDFVRDAYFATPWGTARNPRAPITDLNNLSSFPEALKFLVNSASPLVKTPFEQVAGKSFFTGMPIDNQWEYALQQAPILNDFYKMFKGDSSVLDVLTGKELDVNK
jgi:hypothetical protein